MVGRRVGGGGAPALASYPLFPLMFPLRLTPAAPQACGLLHDRAVELRGMVQELEGLHAAVQAQASLPLILENLGCSWMILDDLGLSWIILGDLRCSPNSLSRRHPPCPSASGRA